MLIAQLVARDRVYCSPEWVSGQANDLCDEKFTKLISAIFRKFQHPSEVLLIKNHSILVGLVIVSIASYRKTNEHSTIEAKHEILESKLR